MCDARRVAAGVLALVALLAQPARAQQAGAAVERLRLRADSLERALAAAEARVEALRPPVRAEDAVVLDTQRVGPLMVIAERSERAYARETVTRALAAVGEIPDAARAALDSTYLFLDPGGVPDELVRQVAGARVERVELPRWMPRSTHVRGVAQSLEVVLARALPADLRAWMGNARIPLASDAVYGEAYRSLALSASPAARACLDGDVARCLDALSLADPGVSWARWYDADFLVDWARSQPGSDALPRCESERTVAACRALMERHGPPQPVGSLARASLLRFALEANGADAWRALTSDSAGPIIERVAAAADADAERLVGAWRERVIAARPARFAELGGSSLVTLLWVALLAALASRSTRWRLG